MARWWGSLLGLALLTVVALLTAGCPRKPEIATGEPRVAAPAPAPEVRAPGPKVEVVTPPPRGTAPAPEPVQPAPEVKPVPGVQFADAFFDFDTADLRSNARQALDANIQLLTSNPQIRITIEGHCDERGAQEYNLALGERRARAARDYLVARGIAAGRISTISYGEERPLVLGHDESAWKWNRRAHFVVVK